MRRAASLIGAALIINASAFLCTHIIAAAACVTACEPSEIHQ